MSTVSSMQEKLSHGIERVDLPNKDALREGERDSDKNPEFYGKAQKYWSEIPATVNGMLGGLGYISEIDIKGSANFLRDLKNLKSNSALDCGAGIGRVSKNLLMPRFDKVDMVEQDESFATAARDYCTKSSGDGEVTSSMNRHECLGEIYNLGLQKFCPVPRKYDLIWSQWVLGHLTDEDLLDFYIRIKAGLADGGYFVMKENVTSSKHVELDETDSSMTRPLKTYETILRQAGYRIVKTARQQNFPKGLYPVYMIACKPIVKN